MAPGDPALAPRCSGVLGLNRIIAAFVEVVILRPARLRAGGAFFLRVAGVTDLGRRKDAEKVTDFGRLGMLHHSGEAARLLLGGGIA
jgi:hypothetical protein